jgi:hypothetical protein
MSSSIASLIVGQLVLWYFDVAVAVGSLLLVL